MLDSGVIVEGRMDRVNVNMSGESESGSKPLREKHENNLWYWNLACAIFHGVQAAVALGLGLGSSGNFSKFTLPFSTSFLMW